MKLLLDENLPHQLRYELPGHECFTVAYMGWGGSENGALLALAASQEFDALLTKDANLEYEQNLTDLPLAVVVIQAASTTSMTSELFCRRCWLFRQGCLARL
jgi:predicted nuclease of predicted toxin-antitoxin system